MDKESKITLIGLLIAVALNAIISISAGAVISYFNLLGK